MGEKSGSKVPKIKPELLVFETKVTQLIATSGNKGILDDEIAKQLPDLTNENRVDVINKMLLDGVINIFQTKNGKIMYKIKPKETTPSFDLSGSDTEEKVVYSIIKEAGNKGIWMRDIRFKSNLLPTVLNKILKSLENKKAIKAVKSVAANKKKVYMLFELEPDSTLTGGSWYSDQDFESEFVDILIQQCYRYLAELKKTNEKDSTGNKKGPVAFQNITSACPKDVCKFITNLGISKVPLSEEDIKTILDTLLYDGKVERKITVTGQVLYRAVDSLVETSGLVVMPCAVCPVIRNCHDNSSVNPIKCPYLADWGTKPIKTTSEDQLSY